MSRTSLHTTRCTGCRRIFVNDLWMMERREYHVKYRLSVCPQCMELGGRRTLARTPVEYPPPPPPAESRR